MGVEFPSRNFSTVRKATGRHIEKCSPPPSICDLDVSVQPLAIRLGPMIPCTHNLPPAPFQRLQHPCKVPIDINFSAFPSVRL
jgi:hypothetical protein